MASTLNIERLVAARTARGWDQKQLADLAGVDGSVISRLERGVQMDCRLSVLIALSDALGVPTAFLIRQPEDHTPNLTLTSELENVLERVKGQPPQTQRHAALILNAFLNGLTDS